MKRSPQGIMSSEKASNSPGLCPVKGQKPSLGIFSLLHLQKERYEYY